MQVAGKLELEEAILKFFSDGKVLEARQTASKQAFHALSNGIIANAWNVLYFHVLKQALLKGRWSLEHEKMNLTMKLVAASSIV